MKSKTLVVALKAIKEAEKIILHYYRNEIRVNLKADQSPVTLADTKAEQAIIGVIRKHFPNHSILGEEFGRNEKKSQYHWIIDPIDGTKNYLRQIPLFATQIALLRGNELVFGVSNAPAMNELLYAEKGEGAYLNGKRIHVSRLSKLHESALSFGGLNLFQKHKSLKNLLALVNSVRQRRGIGDAWSYHLLAQGKIDIMIEPETKIWDIAAAKVIVEEAGGRMTDIEGRPINLQSTSAITTNKLLHSRVLKFFRTK